MIQVLQDNKGVNTSQLLSGKSLFNHDSITKALKIDILDYIN